MFKIDKSTHLLILFTFAIIFVVVYLYYTIMDVRKMQKEIKTLSEDVLALKKEQAHENQIVLQEEEKKVIPIVLATEIDDEISSVHTEEIQEVLCVDEEIDFDETAPVLEESVPSVEFSTMRYDDLKDLCKKHNLNQRGTKEALIKRLEEFEKKSP